MIFFGKETKEITDVLENLPNNSLLIIDSENVEAKEVAKKLFDEIAPKYNDRNGGYTRILKLGVRRGDAAPMALLELVK